MMPSKTTLVLFGNDLELHVFVGNMQTWHAKCKNSKINNKSTFICGPTYNSALQAAADSILSGLKRAKNKKKDADGAEQAAPKKARGGRKPK